MNSSSTSMAATAACSMGGFRPPFTASQWQELEHQALIFKYLMAGLPVPPELVIPIKKSFDSISMAMSMSMSMSASYFHHPNMGYCSFYGKKPDPEPGRCRRTDGKKWRCSKDAYPDSKYCERHMHRGRNRSRKPVETQTITPSSSSSSTLTASPSPSPSPSGVSGTVSFQNLPLHPNTNSPGLGMTSGTNSTHLQMDPLSYGIRTKEYRYLHGMKQEAGENSFLSDPCGSTRGLGMDTSLESSWRLMPSRVSSFTKSKMRNGPTNQIDYPGMHALQGFGQEPTQQHSFFGAEYGLGEAVKQEGQSLRPFFDEWPKTRGSWSDLEEDRSNPTSFSTTTQLSISIPMASSDFSATSSQSPNDD